MIKYYEILNNNKITLQSLHYLLDKDYENLNIQSNDKLIIRENLSILHSIFLNIIR